MAMIGSRDDGQRRSARMLPLLVAAWMVSTPAVGAETQFWVIGSYETEDVAWEVAEDAERETDTRVVIVPALVNGLARYRLMVLRPSTALERRLLAATLREAGYGDAWIIGYSSPIEAIIAEGHRQIAGASGEPTSTVDTIVAEPAPEPPAPEPSGEPRTPEPAPTVASVVPEPTREPPAPEPASAPQAPDEGAQEPAPRPAEPPRPPTPVTPREPTPPRVVAEPPARAPARPPSPGPAPEPEKPPAVTAAVAPEPEPDDGRGPARRALATGIALAEERLYEAAIDAYSKGIEAISDHELLYYNRALAYHKTDQYQLAINDYTAAIELDPEFSDAFNNRGASYRELKEYEKAAQDFRKASELSPRNLRPKINRARLLLFQVAPLLLVLLAG